MCSLWRPGALLALLILALCSEWCDARAQSDRTRPLSGSRNAPASADTKEEFSCPEEFGYYPHPTDCSRYFVCVFGGALLEKCTGGLMYSHELQTCDWPRNVGCDATNRGGAESSALSEPPRRAPPPPPPPRAQPNPVVTSRGQPRISQEEYVKQQQLYSEIDELPPAEEAESDRPQRVYRGQPSTVGQVQRDRDGYAPLGAGRSLNANLIPAPASQPGKVGAFSFGTQVDQRRTSPAQEPQSYREEKNVTDNTDRQADYETNKIDSHNGHRLIRKKRNTNANETKLTTVEESATDAVVDRKDRFLEDIKEILEEAADGESYNDDRNKRQIRHGRYHNNNGYNRNVEVNSWTTANPSKSFQFSQFNQKPPHYEGGGVNTFHEFRLNNNNAFKDVSNKPYLSDNTVFTTASPYHQHQTSHNSHNKPFKASSPDPYNTRLPYNPLNAATQIITKSPPISSLTSNNNPFTALAGGFYNNNVPRQNIEQNRDIYTQNQVHRQPYFQQSYNSGANLKHHDSSEVPTSVVTNKPIRIQSTVNGRVKYRIKPEENENIANANKQMTLSNTRRPINDNKPIDEIKETQENEEEEYDEDSDEEEDNGYEENKYNTTKEDNVSIPDFPEPPYEFTHTKDKYADIVNPFADPNFDFDGFISKLRNSHLSAVGEHIPVSHKPRIPALTRASSTANIPITEKSKSERLVANSAVSYQGMSTPRPFSVPTKTIVSWPAKSNSGTTEIPKISNNEYVLETTRLPMHQHFYSTQPAHTQNKSPKMLKYSFNGDETSIQATLHNENRNPNIANKYKNTNVQILEESRPTKNGLPLENRFENNSFGNNVHYGNANIKEYPQQQPTELAKYSLNEKEQTFPLPMHPGENPSLRLKPPNFKDDRRLPINHNFNSGVGEYLLPPRDRAINNFRTTVTRPTISPKPYMTVVVTSPTPLIYTSKPQLSYSISPQSLFTGRPQVLVSGKTAYFTTAKPQTYNFNFDQSSIKGLNPYIQATQLPYIQSTQAAKPQFNQAVTAPPRKYLNSVQNYYLNSSTAEHTTTTVKPTPKRRPIPKPSPEMNDYYYDDDDEYYYEPPVKSQFMPSSEVRPQRPPIAQNDEEYEDDDSYEDEEDSTKPTNQKALNRPNMYRGYLKKYNDVSEPTKIPFKQASNTSFSTVNGKIPVPVMVNFQPSTPPTLNRPQLAKYEFIHSNKSKITGVRKPMNRYRKSGPHTAKPPKYLNQTTLRPYTIRHRLAKPTTVPMMQTTDSKQARGQNKWRQTTGTRDSTVTSSTPHDSHNQETRFTKTRHDDRTNSLEPTESVTPASYSARPAAGRALYNGSQSYNPDQYDPYYALYDEDGELYKDSDYVQQHNSASFRPAVQQTYRGTPPPPPPAPPARRPVHDYTARPVPDEYDDALIQGQIDDQNQYQQPIRQSTRGEGNELGYEHNPSSARTTIYEATSISTTPPTTTTSTTTKRPTSAPITEAMTPSRNTQRSTSDESINRRANASATEESSVLENPIISLSLNPVIPANFSLLAKPFERTSNSFRLNKLPYESPYNLSSPGSKSMTVLTRPLNNNQNNRKHFSLTTGFSIRKDPKNSQSPYTLTVITRPSITSPIKKNRGKVNDSETENNLNKYFYHHTSDELGSYNHDKDGAINAPQRRADSLESILGDNSRQDIVRETIFKPQQANSLRSEVQLEATDTTTEKSSSRVYLKTIIKRPAPFTLKKGERFTNRRNSKNEEDDLERKWQPLIEKAFDISQNFTSSELTQQSPTEQQTSPRTSISFGTELRQQHETLETLRNDGEINSFYNSKNQREIRKNPSPEVSRYDYLNPVENKHKLENGFESVEKIESLNNSNNTETATETQSSLSVVTENIRSNANNKQILDTKFADATNKHATKEYIKPSNVHQGIVNIGFRKKLPYYSSSNEKIQVNNRRLQIIKNDLAASNEDNSKQTFRDSNIVTDHIFLRHNVMSSTPQPSTHMPILVTSNNVLSEMASTTTTTHAAPKYGNIRKSEESFEYTTYVSKFERITENYGPSEDYEDRSQTLKNLSDASEKETDKGTDIFFNSVGTELTELPKTRMEPVTFIPHPRQNKTIDADMDNIVTTTRMTMKVIDTTTTPMAKTTPYPTRASRINPAIKLAATNPGAGRRSYQSSSKCSTDDSLQANPKCNEIKYPRTNTRGRGSAHYSTSSGADPPQFNNVNRGTPPARLRPTLKPSTAIVSKEAAFVDIYQNPPTRPPAIYPQPTPDKTAAKCRKDVCLLPDCSCGGKEIPGDLPVESVPQMVLLTFDDSVNDLNKVLYADLFEKGRVNPNGCPLAATFYVSHEWTDYSQVQNLYAGGHEMASHTISHSFGEQFSQKKWNREVAGQREILAAYGGVKLEDVRGMRAPFLSVGGNKMFKMLYDSNFTYDSSMPVYENRPPSWPYTLDYKLFHDCMIPPCPTRSYPGVWEVPMVMWQDLNGGRCSMGDACANPPNAEGVYKMLLKNFDRHYTTNRAPFGLFYHAAWFTQPHHKEGFIMFMDAINQMQDVFFVTNWQALQWVRDPTPLSRINSFQPFHCDYPDRPKRCNNPKVCNLWHKSGVRYMRTCQPCPEVYPWTGKTGIRSSRIDNDVEE